jgi:hypothetical protein
MPALQREGTFQSRHVPHEGPAQLRRVKKELEPTRGSGPGQARARVLRRAVRAVTR